MASHCSEKTIPLPRGWTKRVKSALIQSVSLAELDNGFLTDVSLFDRSSLCRDTYVNYLSVSP